MLIRGILQTPKSVPHKIPWLEDSPSQEITTRNVVIYDENFMTFLYSVTIVHNPWKFSDFRHEFEGMGPRPKP